MEACFVECSDLSFFFSGVTFALFSRLFLEDVWKSKRAERSK